MLIRSLPAQAEVLEWQTTNSTVPARVANLWLRAPGSTSLWSVDVDVSSEPAGVLLSEQLVHDVQPPMRGDRWLSPHSNTSWKLTPSDTAHCEWCH